MSPHPFDRYLQAHGHYPRARVPTGQDSFVEVQVAPGYIIVTAHPRAPIFIPRSATIKLLRWLLPLLRRMDQEFSVEDAIHAYHEQEMAYLTALRAEKRTRQNRRRRRR